MNKTDDYSIPVPAWFRCPPLTKLPWSIFSVPKMLARKSVAEENLCKKIKKTYGVKHCLLTDSARSAYAVYIKAADLQGEIVVPSIMHTPTAVLLANLGMKLVFCDVNEDFCASVKQFDSVVSDDTKAVMVTHLFGRVSPIDEIAEWGQERSIKVLSNMVHVPPCVRLQNKPLATYGDVAFLSFNMDKPLHGIYGGAMLTNSDELYQKAVQIPLKTKTTFEVFKLLCRYLTFYRYKPMIAPLQYMVLSAKREYLKNDDVEKTFENFNIDTYVDFAPKKIHPWQASFAECLLALSDQIVERRRERALLATSLLSGIPELTLPREDAYPNAFQYYPILLDETISRFDLGVELARKGFESKWRYYPLHLQKKFRDIRKGELTHTVKIWNNYLLLPVFYGTPEHVKRLAETIREFISGTRKKVSV